MTYFFHVVTLKGQAFVTKCYQCCAPLAQQSGFCERSRSKTVPCTSTTFWIVGISRCFFRGPIRWKTFGGKLGQLGGWARHSNLSWCNEGSAYRTVWDLGLSDPVPWRSILMVTDFKMLRKCRKLSYSYFVGEAQNSTLKACIHSYHIVTNAWTFRMAMWCNKTLFCFLVRKVILKKINIFTNDMMLRQCI